MAGTAEGKIRHGDGSIVMRNHHHDEALITHAPGHGPSTTHAQAGVARNGSASRGLSPCISGQRQQQQC